MIEGKDTVSSRNLTDYIIKGIQEKKGKHISIINLQNINNAVADFFVVCTGTSDTQVDALSDAVEKEVYKLTGMLPWQKEGQNNKQWVLLDYVDVVVHVFLKSVREFYSLEELWGDAEVTHLEDVE